MAEDKHKIACFVLAITYLHTPGIKSLIRYMHPLLPPPLMLSIYLPVPLLSDSGLCLCPQGGIEVLNCKQPG